MDTVRNITPTGDTSGEWPKLMADIEHEPSLDEAKEVPLADMTQEELAVVILHDPDLNERRAALRLYKIDVLQEIEAKHLRMMADIRKAVGK